LKKEVFPKAMDNLNFLLGQEIKQLIEDSRQKVAVTVNAEITLLYWNIGNRINKEILKEQRAEYGKQVLSSLSSQLVTEFGKVGVAGN
jgi:hypothetical protein